MPPMKILVANVGSTSFKYRLFDMNDETVIAEGRLERIGDARCPVEHRAGGREARFTCALPDTPAAIRNVMDALSRTGAIRGASDLDAVGFKTVHMRGEPGIYLLDDGILERMAEYNELAPAHNPPYILAIGIFRELYPGLPLVGLFEPAFHTTIPDYAYTYSVPFSWHETYGVRNTAFTARPTVISPKGPPAPEPAGRGPEPGFMSPGRQRVSVRDKGRPVRRHHHGILRPGRHYPRQPQRRHRPVHHTLHYGSRRPFYG